MQVTGSFHFEIENLITGFMSAFDDTIIKRYNKDREEKDQIQVRYVYGPKHRVLHDIVNKARHIQIPAVSVQLNSVKRDPTRTFNKLYGDYRQVGTDNEQISNTNNFVPQPVAVNVGVTMSMITKYQTDMDQIVSNFVPFTDPYIVISWKIPTGFISGDDTTEIRTHVHWDQQINYDYPTDLDKESPYRLTADTTFNIEGFLFRNAPTTQTQNILYIDTTLTPVTSVEIIN